MQRRTQLFPHRLGFTLVELLIVIIVIAVLAAIAIPKFINASSRSKESSLSADLKLVRNAITVFQNDTGLFPAAITDLAATSVPTSGKDATGTTTPIITGSWKGPYMASVPNDPVSGSALTYSVTAGSVGQVNSSMTGNDSNGNPFSGY